MPHVPSPWSGPLSLFQFARIVIDPSGSKQALRVEIQEATRARRGVQVFGEELAHVDPHVVSNPFRATAIGKVRNSDCLIGHESSPWVGPRDPSLSKRGRLVACTFVAPVLAAFALLASAAHADPCKAIPDHGPMPSYLYPGASFSGPVTYVGDGDSLCVAVGSGPQNWVEVRLADFYAPESREPAGPAAKAALERIAKGRAVDCQAQHQSYDRVVAVCRLRGVSLGELMRRAGVAEGGRGWK